MRVFSLKEEPGSPRYASALQTDYAFWQRGYEVITFERSQLSSGEFDGVLQTEAEDMRFETGMSMSVVASLCMLSRRRGSSSRDVS